MPTEAKLQRHTPTARLAVLDMTSVSKPFIS